MADKDLQITTLAGGQNDTDSPSELAEDEATLMENVELFFSALGERRNGCGPLDISGSVISTEAIVTHISQWFPTNKVLEPEFFFVAATPTVSAKVIRRSITGTWSTIVPTDALSVVIPDIYEITTQSLNGKLFVAYHGAADRLHVWDGTTLRWAGFVNLVGVTNYANEGSGTYATLRYFRARYVTISGGVVLRRSEPGASSGFTPSGTGAGIAVTRPVLLGEGETHWELEASTDNITFYRIATTINSTLTINDETPFATGYAAVGVLSEAIGTYLNIWSARYLAVDGDRLLFAGHWTDVTKQSLVGWSPVLNDPGVGNDERLPTGTGINNTKNLDNYDGGPITGLAAGATGTWYTFKWKRIYKFTRTGDVTNAYEVMTISSTHGAIPGSVVRGVDENGAGCVYFLDPSLGPSRMGPGGLQVIVGLRTTWARVNTQAASVVARGCYYPSKQQVIWWVATDGADRPNFAIKLQVTEIRAKQAQGGNGIGRGWTVATGRIAEAAAVGVLTEIVSINGISQVSDRPFIGLTSPDFVQRCDTESTDAGVAYRAIIRTRPYIIAGLLNKWGAMTAALLAAANPTATINVKFLRDFGKETTAIQTSLAATGTETDVVKIFDDLVMSDATTIQIELSDL